MLDWKRPYRRLYSENSSREGAGGGDGKGSSRGSSLGSVLGTMSGVGTAEEVEGGWFKSWNGTRELEPILRISAPPAKGGVRKGLVCVVCVCVCFGRGWFKEVRNGGNRKGN